jgi:hypothetical protein
MSLHSILSEQLITDFGERLVDLPRLNHDALEVRFDTGLILQIRYPNIDEYSLRWSFKERTLGIDTAPLHPDLDSFPNHLHDSEGRIVSDRLTRPGRPVQDNLHALIVALLDDPWLLRGTVSM